VVRLNGDQEPTYRWAALIIIATIVCLVLGALMAIGAFKMAEKF
jgi:uncharacterized membrane protein YqjE